MVQSLKRQGKKYKRMCVACRKMFIKEALLRFVRTKEQEVFLKKSLVLGRSCYVCYSEQCRQVVKKKRLLDKYLKCFVPKNVYDEF